MMEGGGFASRLCCVSFPPNKVPNLETAGNFSSRTILTYVGFLLYLQTLQLSLM